MKIGVARTSVASISETWVRRITNPEQISAIRVKGPPGGVPRERCGGVEPRCAPRPATGQPEGSGQLTRKVLSQGSIYRI
jgi:hypothetical protein